MKGYCLNWAGMLVAVMLISASVSHGELKVEDNIIPSPQAGYFQYEYLASFSFFYPLFLFADLLALQLD